MDHTVLTVALFLCQQSLTIEKRDGLPFIGVSTALQDGSLPVGRCYCVHGGKVKGRSSPNANINNKTGRAFVQNQSTEKGATVAT